MTIPSLGVSNYVMLATEERAYGKTGEKFAILSFRAQRLADSHECSEPDTVRIMNYALGRGICYLATATSVLDRFVVSFAEEFLPIAKAEGVAVAGMKFIGLGRLAGIYDKALRYAVDLPVNTAVVGTESMDQLRRNLKVAEAYRPLNDEERLKLFKEVMPRVIPKGVPWKAED